MSLSKATSEDDDDLAVITGVAALDDIASDGVLTAATGVFGILIPTVN